MLLCHFLTSALEIRRDCILFSAPPNIRHVGALRAASRNKEIDGGFYA
jgi:hypothetical protein